MFNCEIKESNPSNLKVQYHFQTKNLLHGMIFFFLSTAQSEYDMEKILYTCCIWCQLRFYVLFIMQQLDFFFLPGKQEIKIVLKKTIGSWSWDLFTKALTEPPIISWVTILIFGLIEWYIVFKRATKQIWLISLQIWQDVDPAFNYNIFKGRLLV